ncbi:hypothetical protein NDU88_005131 [Pleurodeles waltl]|uniref:Uncharacterized protein n=1 Tax=Pleurodeles waltl TaxID=8319 RepID=A0AAV7MVU8_PLEWA|nr:hypothetical protein NDU88_005131 [Pleurodeles waltl]
MDVTAIFYLFNHSIPDLRQEKTYTASAAVTSVSAYQKKDIWRAIAKDVWTLGVYHRRSPTPGKVGRTFAAGARRRRRLSWGWPPNMGGVPVAP